MIPGMFKRRAGREDRAWPMLALLLLVVLVAIGCVLWFWARRCAMSGPPCARHWRRPTGAGLRWFNRN